MRAGLTLSSFVCHVVTWVKKKMSSFPSPLASVASREMALALWGWENWPWPPPATVQVKAGMAVYLGSTLEVTLLVGVQGSWAGGWESRKTVPALSGECQGTTKGNGNTPSPIPCHLRQVGEPTLGPWEQNSWMWPLSSVAIWEWVLDLMLATLALVVWAWVSWSEGLTVGELALLLALGYIGWASRGRES